MNTFNKKREDPEKIWEGVSLDGDFNDSFVSRCRWLQCRWFHITFYAPGERPCLWQHLRWSFWLRTFIGTSLPCLDGPTPVHHVDVDDPELLGEGRQGRRRPPEDEFIVMDVFIFCLVLHGRKSASSFVMLLVMIAEMMAMFVILMMMTNKLHLRNVEKRGRVDTPIPSPLRKIVIEIDSITLLD